VAGASAPAQRIAASRQPRIPILVEGDVGAAAGEAEADGFIDRDADEGLAREGALAGLPFREAMRAVGEGGVR
jgi:hypothetical protein